MDSAQMWFCRDLWVDAAKGGLKDGRGLEGMGGGREDGVESQEQRFRRSLVEPEGRKSEKAFVKRQQEEQKKKQEQKKQAVDTEEDEDAKAAENAPPPPPQKVEEDKVEEKKVVNNAPAAAPPADDNKPVFAHNNKEAHNAAEEALYDGTAQDAMPEADNNAAPPPIEAEDQPEVQNNLEFLVPNSAFQPARILVNPRCVTTYGGVSHTKLALDLFGGSVSEVYDGGSSEGGEDGQYLVTDWAGAPDRYALSSSP
jgi:hypothetical protein